MTHTNKLWLMTGTLCILYVMTYCHHAGAYPYSPWAAGPWGYGWHDRRFEGMRREPRFFPYYGGYPAPRGFGRPWGERFWGPEGQRCGRVDGYGYCY